MALSYVLLAVSFAMLLAGAFVFTNAIEWAGMRLNLGHGAVGSILAAVATALPESTIPVIAIITGGGERSSIAIGAIIGAPFLLGTLAMLLVGASAIGFRNRRDQDVKLSLNVSTMVRDLTVFLVFLGIALVLGLIGPRMVSIIAAIVFVIAYGTYVWRTITAGHGSQEDEEMQALFFDPSKQNPPRNPQIIVQVIVGLGLIIYGAHLFVVQIEHIATTLGISALLLALVLAPLASELPEKINSFLWVSRGKDTLALGNITGAMVFQSMLPVAAGLAFTQWQLSGPAAVVAGAALIGGLLALLAIRYYGRFPPAFMVAWGVLYVGGVAYVIVGT
ncbi:sodium:calcium antiporter [Haloactinomyces albus]|uniref:Cation:H+ antiporter n=1 Tax=Haloactinomyces albus TaxID=1352928 RepID=A0AAE3ZAU7_9ACTN|nr:hypothetical protein [Haloactinomyces albus]MDR7300109.1 cation:H+ antiporter [Haloactinomyces albus]